MEKLFNIKNKAFTLLETVVVLFIFCLVMSIPYFHLQDYQNDLAIKNTTRQVKATINRYCRYAILTDKAYIVDYKRYRNEIEITSGKMHKKVSINPEVKVSGLNDLRIVRNGHISPRTIVVSSHNKKQEIKVQMQWGRMIEK